jgi:hypothetical protein
MNELLKWFSNWLEENPAAANFFVIAAAMLIFVVIFLYIKAFLEGREISFFPPKIGKKSDIKDDNNSQPNQIDIFESSADHKFSDLFVKFFLKAHRVVLIGTGFYTLRLSPIRTKLDPLIRPNHELEIYAANPFSPNVQTRLVEEETGYPNPDIQKHGLEKWLRDLLEKKKENESAKFSLQLFPFYPTYALFIFDDQDYFFYPYGYAKVGNVSPVLHYSKGSPGQETMVKFLDDQYKLVKERSVDAELIFNLHRGNKEKVDKNTLAGFAVYLIPSADTPLYKFGSEILEYDVRSKRELQHTKWHNYIGAAFDYGLHVTIADALYCAAKSDINLICKEVEFLANEFRPFTLNLSLEKDFPNKKGIALVCTEDKTGSLEALHHEMVARVYRKAVASNYDFDPTLADRDLDKERATLMIKHYHAPYILQRFKPHFSLLSNVNVSPEKKEQIYGEISKLYEKNIKDSSIEISQIAIMHRPDPQGHWQILHEYPLGGAS